MASIEKEFLTSEEQLLILAARLNLQNEAADAIHALLQAGVDWVKVLELSFVLGMRPLLFRHLTDERNVACVPQDVLASLQDDYDLQMLRSMRIYGCIKQVLASMNQADIPVILLKGAYLAQWIYQDIALRPMSDVDILCRQEDQHRAQEKLVEIGYRDTPGAYHSPLHERILNTHASHAPAIYNPKVTRVEVHSELFKTNPKNVAQMDRVWETFSHESWEGLTVFALSPEYQLLYLCSHLHKHCAAGDAMCLYWFCDIHETIIHYGDTIDWETLYRQAEDLEIAAQVKSILKLVKQRWHTPVVEDKKRAFCGLREEADELSLSEILHDTFKGKRGALPYYLHMVAMVKQVEGWSNRLFYLWKLIFPSKENIIYRYHPANHLSLCLWYAAHPFIVAWRTLESLYYNVVHLMGKANR
jgi:hypothetical protein